MIWGVWLLEYAWIFFSILTINNYKGFNPRGTFRESCPPPLKPDLVYSQYAAVSEHSCGQGLRLHCPSRPWHACTLDPAAPPLGFFIWSFDCWSSSCTFGEGFLPGGASQIVQWKEFAWQCRRGKTHRFNPWAGKIPWRQKWLATPVFLPGTFHGQRSLAGSSPWGHQDLDTAWACTFKRGERGSLEDTCPHFHSANWSHTPLPSSKLRVHKTAGVFCSGLPRPPQFLHQTMLIYSEPADCPLGQSSGEEIQ